MLFSTSLLRQPTAVCLGPLWSALFYSHWPCKAAGTSDFYHGTVHSLTEQTGEGDVLCGLKERPKLTIMQTSLLHKGILKSDINFNFAIHFIKMYKKSILFWTLTGIILDGRFETKQNTDKTNQLSDETNYKFLRAISLPHCRETFKFVLRMLLFTI